MDSQRIYESMNHPDTVSKKPAEIEITQAQFRISAAVISSYLVKAVIKLTTGVMFSVLPLIADGIHGIIDIFEHTALVIAGRHARKQDREKYPLDREPLIDLMGMAIFIGLFFVGCKFFVESVKIIVACLIKIQWIKLEVPIWLTNALPELTVLDKNVLWVVSLILLLCYGISEIVFRFQSNLATKYSLREMKADAMELRSDGWLELSMGIGFLVGWIATIFISATSNSSVLNYISSLISGLILFALSIYLVRITIPELYEKYQNLMNLAIPSMKRTQLEKIINNRIPSRCRVIHPLITYFRGQQLFIAGQISIDRSIMISADLVLAKAERITEMFLSDLDNDIHVRFSPFFVWDQESIEQDLNSVLKEIWEVPTNSPTAESFRQLRRGNLEQSLKTLSDNDNTNRQETALASYVRAEILFRLKGVTHPDTKGQIPVIDEILNEILSIPASLMLNSWYLIYLTDAIGHLVENDLKIRNVRKTIEELISKSENIPNILRAETSFALGYSWERCHEYDLKKCTEYYRQSELFYINSGIRSESDRLLNTWGHLETLTYSLGDALDHLELALAIRKLRNDPLSLSFTYGCLGDLYNRLGDFVESDLCYAKDLNLLAKLGIDHQIPQVLCKQGESRIRGGLIENDVDSVNSGIQLCVKAEKMLGKSNPQGRFFAIKGQLKGCLGLSALSGEACLQSIEKQCSVLFSALVAQNNYEKAFFFRLRGRYFGLIGDISNSEINLNESSKYFKSTAEPRSEAASSLQSIICRVETLRHQIANNCCNPNKLQPLNELEDFILPFGGMLGDVSERIIKIATNTRESLDGKKLNNKKAVNFLDALIWLMEG
jgi:divalent metal cation (Fe/Co/Zn/Cd) transporter